MRVLFGVLITGVICVCGLFCAVDAQEKYTPVTVMIDPGHGGMDSGAISEAGYEKDIALKVSLRVKEILDSWGIRALTTRASDMPLTLKQRAAVINKTHPDLCVSIHLNSSVKKSVSGFESFVYRAGGKHGSKVCPDGCDHAECDTADASIFSGYWLANCLHQRIVRRTAARDRGVKHGKYYLLKHVSAPCVLLELGFMSNPLESRRLSSAEYQESYALAIAEGIVLAVFGKLDPSKHQLAAHIPETFGQKIHTYKD